MSITSTDQVQEIWFKAQRVLRTIVQVGIPAFLAFAVVLPQILDVSGIPVTSSLYVWLLSVAGGITAVAGGLSRIMAIPAINLWLVKIGLGSVPKAVVNPDIPVTPADPTISTSPEAGVPPAAPFEIDPTPSTAEPKHVARPAD